MQTGLGRSWRRSRFDRWPVEETERSSRGPSPRQTTGHMKGRDPIAGTRVGVYGRAYTPPSSPPKQTKRGKNEVYRPFRSPCGIRSLYIYLCVLETGERGHDRTEFVPNRTSWTDPTSRDDACQRQRRGVSRAGVSHRRQEPIHSQGLPVAGPAADRVAGSGRSVQVGIDLGRRVCSRRLALTHSHYASSLARLPDFRSR